MNTLKNIANAAFVIAAAVCCAYLCGCMSENMGSKTIVGNHYALPKLSNEASNTDFEVYESTEGAIIATRRDSKVTIGFSNSYTNSIFGIWDKSGTMNLTVDIEPLAVDAPAEADEPSPAP